LGRKTIDLTHGSYAQIKANLVSMTAEIEPQASKERTAWTIYSRGAGENGDDGFL